MNLKGSDYSDIKNAYLKFLKKKEIKKSKPIVDKVYPFNESIEAFEHLASGRAKGKIIVKLN